MPRDDAIRLWEQAEPELRARNLEIVSEASRHAPPPVKGKAPQIPWREIADFGNMLRHSYEGVHDPVLWATIQRDLPPLLVAIH